MPAITKTRPAARKKQRLALPIGFLALLIGPGLLWLALRPWCDTANHENRTLASFPDESTALAAWPAAFESWLGDHAPFRNEFLTLKAGVDRAVGTLDSTNVLLGKEGWLFLKDVSDSQSISDYQGLTAYSPQETQTMTEVLLALQQELEAKGSQLALLIAPAKEGVYSQYMPDTIPVVARPTRVAALVQELRQATGAPVIFPIEELTQAAGEQQVYYKYDTHWNDAGAWLAAQQVLAALGRPFESQWPVVMPDPDSTAPIDLANMCGSWRFCTDDLYNRVDTPTAFCTGMEQGGELARYAGVGQDSLLLARDSFGAAIAPHLAQGFGSALVLHGNQLTLNTLQQEQPTLPDVVVVEVGERFCDTLPMRLAVLLEWAQQTE